DVRAPHGCGRLRRGDQRLARGHHWEQQAPAEDVLSPLGLSRLAQGDPFAEDVGSKARTCHRARGEGNAAQELVGPLDLQKAPRVRRTKSSAHWPARGHWRERGMI